MPTSVAEVLSKVLDGIKDQLTSMAQKEEKILKVKEELRGILKLMGRFKKPSEYSSDLKKRLENADIDYSEEDGDHKKNVKLVEDALAKIEDQEQALQMQTQQAMSALTQATSATTNQLKSLNKQQDAIVKNIGG